MGLKDFLKQKNEAQKAERERQKAEERAEAVESIPVEPHPLRDAGKDFVELYVKSVLILRAEVPLEYPDSEEEKKQLRLFGRSLGLTLEKQSELEKEVSAYTDRVKMDTLAELSSRGGTEFGTCFMCDIARLHGEKYEFEGDFADVWSDAAGGVAGLSDEGLAAAEKLSADIASRLVSVSPGNYAPLPDFLVTYFGQEAFRPAGGNTNPDGQYLVIDLSGGANAEQYPTRWTDDKPDLSNDACRTTELWLRRIPAGTFTMGSPEGQLGREVDETQHNVTLSQDCFMGIFPVTQWQWELVMGNNPSDYKTAGPGAPVEQVSYDDICGANRPWPKDASVSPDSFLGKLRAKTGLEGLDLPTEAQWDYSCRAGTTTALNSGKDLTSEATCPNLDEVGWYSENSGDTTHAVGSKRPNEWGLYDMHGNVWEWCRDWGGDYGGDAVDPTGPASGSFRVSRGGGWSDGAWSCRSALRDNHAPGNRDDILGFRLALAPVQ